MGQIVELSTENMITLVNKIVIDTCFFVCVFVHLFSHTCNTGYINYSLQFIYYNTTYNIWTSTQYNIINKNTKFKDQLEVVSVTTYQYMCIYIFITTS